MLLSAQSIRARCLAGALVIEPFCERTVQCGLTYGLGPASYDVRLDQDLLLAPRWFPGSFRLASIMEYLQIPLDLRARVCDKSSQARSAIGMYNTVVDPGWRGFLTLEIRNDGYWFRFLKRGTPIAMIEFELLDEPTELPYSGKYQDQPPHPVSAIHESQPVQRDLSE